MAGNANSGRKRNQFTADALILEMKARERDGDRKGMRAVAVKVWEMAEVGDPWAITFIRDTIDGKPMQQIEHSGTVSTNPYNLTDEELAAIIEGGSGEGTTEAPEGPPVVN
jgi:hypothetical protein